MSAAERDPTDVLKEQLQASLDELAAPVDVPVSPEEEDLIIDVTRMMRSTAEALGVTNLPPDSRVGIVEPVATTQIDGHESTDLVVHKESAVSAEPATQEELVQFVTGMSSRTIDDVFEVLTTALAAERLDPILARIKYRADVKNLLSQLSSQTRALTSIASILAVQYDDSPVAPDPNFANWPLPSMAALVARIEASIGTLSAREAEATRRTRELEARCARLEERIQTLGMAQTGKESVYTAQVEEYRRSALEANTALAAYADMETFMVAQIDPVTKAPVKFLKVDGDRYTGVEKWSLATRLKAFAGAQKRRFNLIRVMKKRARAEEREAVSDNYAVFQLSLRRVTHEDF